MTQPKRNTDGLKRGGITPEAQAKGAAAAAKVREEQNALVELAVKDPYAAYDEMHVAMTRHILKLLKDEARTGGTPDRAVTDRLREYRQLTDSLAAYREAKGEAEAARQFFDALSRRLAQMNMDETSPSGPPDA